MLLLLLSLLLLPIDLIQDLQHQLFRQFGRQDVQRMRHRDDWVVGVQVLEHLHDRLEKEKKRRRALRCDR